MITIHRFIGDPQTGLVHVYYRKDVTSITGDETMEGYMLLEEGDGKDLAEETWGNEELMDAFALRLNIDAGQYVMMATRPPPE